jgi:hypothetical protein
VKLKLLILVSMFFIQQVNGQSKPLPVSAFYKTRVKELQCADSTGAISQSCPICILSLSIVIYRVSFDKSEKELHLTGRVCVLSDTTDCFGFAGVEIFKGVKGNNIVANKQVVGQTTGNSTHSDNDGFFDIRMKVNPKESLFFYDFQFRVEEYKVYELVKGW